MSVFRNKSEILLLEPCDGKLSRTVLRGESARKGADLPASIKQGDALSRYNKMIADRPEIFKQVPLKIIASYLGITQQHLSRIRRK